METWRKGNNVDTYYGSVKSDAITSPRFVFDLLVVVAHERTCGWVRGCREGFVGGGKEAISRDNKVFNLKCLLGVRLWGSTWSYSSVSIRWNVITPLSDLGNTICHGC